MRINIKKPYQSAIHPALVNTLVLLITATSQIILLPVAEASLQVFPTRIMMTDLKRMGQISIRHIGDKPEEYKISAVFYRMNEEGRMEIIKTPEPTEHSAVNMLRFTPRKITLPPNVEQIIRIIALKPANLEAGEYRAHLHLEPLGQESNDSPPSRKADPNAVNMQLSAKMAIAVPIIVRHGKTEVNVKLARLRYLLDQKKTPAFTAELEKTGNGFVFGDIFTFILHKDGTTEQLGLIKGVSSYIPRRALFFPIGNADPSKLRGNRLKVEFREPVEDGGKVLDSAEITVSEQ